MKSEHGGARKGAGPKKKNPLFKKNPKGIKLQQWLIDWLDAQPDSAAVIIENAVIKIHKLKPPADE